MGLLKIDPPLLCPDTSCFKDTFGLGFFLGYSPAPVHIPQVIAFVPLGLIFSSLYHDPPPRFVRFPPIILTQ